MTVTYREGVAILQVVFFIPALLVGVILGLRHGFAKSSGWILLITFSILRLVGSICEIVGLEHPSKGVIIAAIVCISIGISPLTLICLGLLARANQAAGVLVPKVIFKLLSFISMVALALGITGGVKSSSAYNGDSYSITIYSKIAIILFTAIYLIACLINLILLFSIRKIPSGEKRLVLAVTLCIPFVAVRFVYAIVADFGHGSDWSPYFGNVTLYLIMAVVMEFIVVIITEVTGLTLSRQALDQRPGYEAPVEVVEMRVDDSGRAVKPKRPFKGPISWVYYQIKDSRS